MSEINNLNLLGTTYDIVDDSAIHERADWTETNTSSDAYIAHKPENLVQDANYVHTDNNYTTAEKTKLAGLDAGQAKVLTSADYNYPTDNPTSVALWLLDAGIYMPQDGNVSVKATGSVDKTGAGFIYLVGPSNSSGSKLIWCFMGRECNMYDVFSNGSYMSAKNLSSIDVVNNLTSTSSTAPLSANQGKVLKDLIDSTVADETTARQAADTGLQTQIDAIVASSDVKDIVGTKADLNNYDTTTLGNNDIIKVLQDESQSDQTTYYRWSTSTSTFTLIGAEGPYYTKSATDTLLNDKADKSTTYTKTETDTLLNTKQGTLTAGSNIQISSDTISATDTTYSDFTGTDGTAAGAAGLVPAPATTDAGKVLGANGSWVTGGPTVVQTTGTSTTDVMSQNAVTSMVYNDPGTKKNVVIGGGSTYGATDPVAIGRLASVRGNYAVAIGSTAGSQVTNAPGGISLGAFSKAAGQGQMDISLVTATQQAQATYGYNGSAYRLLTGLYDPQNAHDAATKGYVDTAVAGAGAAAFTTNEWNALWA